MHARLRLRAHPAPDPTRPPAAPVCSSWPQALWEGARLCGPGTCFSVLVPGLNTWPSGDAQSSENQTRPGGRVLLNRARAPLPPLLSASLARTWGNRGPPSGSLEPGPAALSGGWGRRLPPARRRVPGAGRGAAQKPVEAARWPGHGPLAEPGPLCLDRAQKGEATVLPDLLGGARSAPG